MPTPSPSRSTERRDRLPRRLAASAAALGAVVVLAGCLSANQTKMVDLANSSRRSAGLGALAPDAATSNKAQAWAERMARTGTVEHTGGGQRIDTSGIPKWCSVAENVGTAPSIDALHTAWMRSSSHKTNILGAYDRVGTGVARKGDQVYGIQIFYRAC